MFGQIILASASLVISSFHDFVRRVYSKQKVPNSSVSSYRFSVTLTEVETCFSEKLQKIENKSYPLYEGYSECRFSYFYTFLMKSCKSIVCGILLVLRLIFFLGLVPVVYLCFRPLISLRYYRYCHGFQSPKSSYSCTRSGIPKIIGGAAFENLSNDILSSVAFRIFDPVYALSRLIPEDGWNERQRVHHQISYCTVF